MKISPKTILLLLPVVGSLAGLLASYAVTPKYVSSATLAFEDTGIEGTAPEVHRHLVDFFVQCQADVLSRTSLSALISSPSLSLYPEERSRLPLEDVIEAMRPQLKVEIVDRPGYPRERFTVFKISFPYREPAKAQLTVQLLITRFIDVARSKSGKEVPGTGGPRPLRERIAQLEARVAALEGHPAAVPDKPAPQPEGPEAPSVSVNVIDPPTLPDSPVYPDRRLFTAAGLAFGLLGVVIGLLFPKQLKLQS